MTPTIHLDFETRSLADMKKGGAGRYCSDPSTRILLYAYAVGDGPVVGVTDHRPTRTLIGYAKKGYRFAAHNAYFEWAVWKNCWRKYAPAPRFTCTMAKCCAHGLPAGLDRASMALKLKHQKHTTGAKLIQRYSIPKSDGSFNDLYSNQEDLKDFMQYCRRDVEVERQIDKMLPELTEFEDDIFWLTMLINDRGAAVDMTLAKRASDMARRLVESSNKEISRLTNGRLHAVTQTVRLKNYLNETFGLNLPGVGSEVIDDMLPSIESPKAREILTLRDEYGQSSAAKFDRVINSVCSDGRIRNYLIYHGASTGRWTSQTVQLHNLPRGGEINSDVCINFLKQGDRDVFETMYEYPMTAITNCVRGVIVAPKGKVLLVADYSAIEARVLMWLAGQKDAVEMFRQGHDIYVEMARVIHSDPDLTKANKTERQLGKQAVLGCGYQMGHRKFLATCKKYGITVEEALAIRAVDAFRERFDCVPQYWKDLERSAIHAVRHKTAVHVGNVTFYPKGRFLYCRLPSGRNLAYYSPGLEENTIVFQDKETGEERSMTRVSLRYFTQQYESGFGFKKTFTYGGKLAENITQGVARDIMAAAMLKLEQQGVSVILSVHDEIICEVDEAMRNRPMVIPDKESGIHAFLDSKVMCDIMCNLPAWAEGCPITAEGWSGKRYKK